MASMALCPFLDAKKWLMILTLTRTAATPPKSNTSFGVQYKHTHGDKDVRPYSLYKTLCILGSSIMDLVCRKDEWIFNLRRSPFRSALPCHVFFMGSNIVLFIFFLRWGPEGQGHYGGSGQRGKRFQTFPHTLFRLFNKVERVNFHSNKKTWWAGIN